MATFFHTFSGDSNPKGQPEKKSTLVGFRNSRPEKVFCLQQILSKHILYVFFVGKVKGLEGCAVSRIGAPQNPSNGEDI